MPAGGLVDPTDSTTLRAGPHPCSGPGPGCQPTLDRTPQEEGLEGKEEHVDAGSPVNRSPCDLGLRKRWHDIAEQSHMC
ncbi:hypothetical protein H920_10944 [Fukomys damarensis]|uniref:Uncharacterized protein n=2 Tax=Fukomys damarensis TaxID=885580 RepID=A0A091D9E9_FUKDA|nr:hypothetical protein H920_10944 [Fukomys damarensis]